MKRKLPIAVLVVALLAFGVRREFSYPQAWDKIHVGMTRQEVYSLIGPGKGEWPGIKGPFWRQNGIIVWHELQLSITKDRVTHVWVNRYVGKHSPAGFLRSEPAESQEY